MYRHSITSRSFAADLGPEGSAKLATVFDYGGIIGAIAAGVLSDYSSMPATTCSGMLAAAIPAVSSGRSLP